MQLQLFDTIRNTKTNHSSATQIGLLERRKKKRERNVRSSRLPHLHINTLFVTRKKKIKTSETTKGINK